MKTIITTLLLMGAAVASVLEVEPPRKTFLLPTKITRLTLFSPDGITVRWIPVRIPREPVIGYKLKLRVFEGTIINKIESVNGTDVEVEEIVTSELGDVTLDTAHKLHEYNINGANHTELTIHGIKRETPYMVDVLPYSLKGDGPTSLPLSFKIRKDSTVSFVSRHNVVIVNKLSAPESK